MFKADQGCSHTFWWIYIVIGASLEEGQHLHLQEKVQYKYFGQYNIGHHLLSEWSEFSEMVWVVWNGLRWSGWSDILTDLLTEWSECSEMVWNGLGGLSGLEWSGWSDLLLDLLTEWSEWSGMVWDGLGGLTYWLTYWLSGLSGLEWSGWSDSRPPVWFQTPPDC